MNQDFNNFNQDNSNIGNNGVPNNQPLNNNAYQQQVNPVTQQFQNNGFNQNQSFQQTNNQNQQVNPNTYQQPVQNNKPKKSKIGLILAIIGGFVVGVVVLFIIIFAGVSATSDKLICKSDEGNITIMYNKDGLTGYKAIGMTYEYEQQKELAKQMGVDEYISEFNEWFITNTTGSCTINGKKVESKTSVDNAENTTNNNSTTTDTKTVGDSKYGYIDIPNNWVTFKDIDGNDSLQYSYANVYIVSLNMLDGNYSAKDYASNYMYSKQNSSDVTDVTGATVKIGKNNEYTAYQVYMYYPSDATYLVTYWFEAEDGNVHYIALEGPASVTDYLSIPQSFRLKK